jgi:ElaB/YqjD/DUF883 family membrane-anchored ribosome-binding protein
MAYRPSSQVSTTDPGCGLPADTRAVHPQLNEVAAQIGSALGRAVCKVREMPRRGEQIKDELRNRLQTIRDKYEGPGFTRIRESAEQTANDIKGRARENVQIARNRAERLARESPVEIIVAAFGAAFLLGIALRIRRSNNA